MEGRVATQVSVIGSGAWGTALAILANRTGSHVTLWSRNPNVIEPIRHRRINSSYLPDIFIDPAIVVTDNLDEACDSEMLFLAIPSQYLRSVCIAISDLVETKVPLIVCTKGIERGSLALMSEVVRSILPHNPVAALSGPNFADEAARGLPTATTVACDGAVLGESILYAIGGKLFRPYLTDDIVGTQIGGAVKNVLAIACGIAAGKKMGENARAALITRGLAEMTRLCLAKGGRLETLMGLSGIGDVMLTCGSMKSRNMSFGAEIGAGQRPTDVLANWQRGVAEGVTSAESVTELAQKLGVSMPICQAVHRIINGLADVDEAMHTLLSRPFIAEFSR